MTHTKDLLANALREIGLKTMATLAEGGYYHDFMSPLPLPEAQLLDDLLDAARRGDQGQANAILALRRRVINGEFDSTVEEGDEWAASEDGQEAFRLLSKGASHDK